MALRYPNAELVWFDPGGTTGMCVLSVQPRWLAGEGEPTWEGLRKALKHVWIAQVGLHSRVEGREGRSMEPIEGRAVPIEAELARARMKRLASLDGYTELRRETDMVSQCVDLLTQWPRAAWGFESFQLRTVAADRCPERVAAKMSHAELLYGEGRAPYAQTASYAKTTATDERLRLCGLYRAGIPHGVDAIRHAATFLRKARKDGQLRSDAWPRFF